MIDNKKLLQKAIVQVRRPQNFLDEDGIKLYKELMFFERHLPPKHRTETNKLLGIQYESSNVFKKIAKVLVYAGSVVGNGDSKTFNAFKTTMRDSENGKKR